MESDKLLIRPTKLEIFRKQLELKIKYQEEIKLAKKNNFLANFKNIFSSKKK